MSRSDRFEPAAASPSVAIRGWLVGEAPGEPLRGGSMVTTDEGRLVVAARGGDDRAFGQLFDAWFDRVHDLSRRIVRDPEVAAEVAQDAFLTAWTKLDSLEDPDAFGGWLLRVARNKSLNRLEREGRSSSTEDETLTALVDQDAPGDQVFDELDDAGRVSLVWEAAAALGPRDTSVLDLHLRQGMAPKELAEELGCTPNNAHQVMFSLRKRLGNAVQAFVLWRGGRPTCADLRSALDDAGATRFNADTMKVIDRHAKRCDDCSEDRLERVSPAALFGAAPVLLAPAALKGKAASGLEADGVPMAGAQGATSASSPDAGSGDATTPARSGSGLGGGDAPGGAVGGTLGTVPDSGPDDADAEGRGDDPDDDLDDPGAGGSTSGTGRRRALAALAGAAVLVAGVVLWPRGDDPDRVESRDVASAPVTPTRDDQSSSEDTTTTIGGLDITVEDGNEITPGTLRVVPTPDDGGSGNGGGGGGGGGDPVGPGGTETVEVVEPPPSQTTPTFETKPKSETSTTVAELVLPPTIDQLSVAIAGQCPSNNAAYQWTLTWQTTHADRVIVSPDFQPQTVEPPDGQVTKCGNGAGYLIFNITAEGPGGTVSDTIFGGD